MTGLYVDQCTSLANIYATGSGSISSMNIEGCTKLQVFQRDDSVNVPGEKPAITTESLPDAYIGDVYSAYVQAKSNTNAPIRYRISSIPTDWSKSFSCSTTGTITGTLTGTPPSGGSINITIAATNFVGSSTKTFSLAIKTHAVAPTITTTSLPDGKVGEAYSAQVTATGTTPITFELNATALANGLSINSSTGKITGTPTTTRDSLTVKVTASNVAGSSYKDFTIKIAAASGSDIDTDEDDITIKPEFTTANLTLSGQIAVNFYMNLPPISSVNYSNSKECYTVFDINGDTTSNNPQPVDGQFISDGDYGFKCYVNSVQMADPIVATFNYGKGKSVQCTYSVKKYLDNRINKTTSASMKNLAIAIKNYGHYAQVYLARVNGWTLGQKHIALDAASNYTTSDIEYVRGIVDQYRVIRDSFDGTGIDSASYSLSLDSETTINLTFTMETDYTGDFKAYLNGGSQNLAVKQYDGSYKIQISGISAHKLADTQTVKIYVGKDISFKVSGLTFVYTSMKGSNIPEDRQKLAVALYKYYEATMAYRNAQ